MVSAELRLLDPAVRASAAEVSALLHDEFVEYGASGAVWDRTQTVTKLAADPHPSAIMIMITCPCLDTGK